MERTWLILAFGDISGFGSWMYRADIAHELKEPFIQDFYNCMRDFVLTKTGNHFKYLGDGMMIAKELESHERRNGAVVQFVRDCQLITKQSKELVKRHGLGGFRIRIGMGYAYKIMVPDPNDMTRTRMVPEYVESVLNTTERLLEVSPEITCLCTDIVADALGKKGKLFGIRPVGKTLERRKGVNQETLDGLKVVHF